MTPEAPCRCGVHSQHKVFRCLIQNPGITLRAAAKECGLSYVAVRLAKHRLKQRNTSRLCPVCFAEAVENLVCRKCGAELDAPMILSEEFDSQSPVHSVQPLSGLGSSTNYNALRLQYGGRNIGHLVEHPTDPLLERAKSKLWEELKAVMPPDAVVEEATRMLCREAANFRARYPELVRSKGLGHQLVQNVLAVMRLRYGARFGVSPVPAENEATAPGLLEVERA
jgi:hypothetical protein